MLKRAWGWCVWGGAEEFCRQCILRNEVQTREQVRYSLAGVANLRAVGSLKTECCLGWIGPFLPTRQEEDTRCKPIPVLSLSRLNPEPPKRTGPNEMLGRNQRKHMKMPPLRESCKKQVIPWERLALPQQPKLYLGPKWLG